MLIFNFIICTSLIYANLQSLGKNETEKKRERKIEKIVSFSLPTQADYTEKPRFIEIICLRGSQKRKRSMQKRWQNKNHNDRKKDFRFLEFVSTFFSCLIKKTRCTCYLDRKKCLSIYYWLLFFFQSIKHLTVFKTSVNKQMKTLIK